MTTDVAALISDSFDLWTSAIERKPGAGRGRGKKLNLYGIEQLRALILGLAVRGKLVPQDADEEPATALLSKMATERQRRIKSGEIKSAKGPSKPISEPFVVPLGWVWLPLWQTGNIFTGNSISAAVRSELEKNEIGRPFVATKDVGYGLEPIDYENGLVVACDDQRFTVARPRSVFICAEGGSAGRKVAISDREISFGNKLIANEPWSLIEPRYVLYTYLSDFFFECFSKEMTGIIGGISRAKFLALPFPLPPLGEQQRIVAKVDELMALCDALETQSASSIDAHQALVEALLATLVNAHDTDELAREWARLEAHFDTLFTTEASIEALKQAALELAVAGKLIVGNGQERWIKAKLREVIGAIDSGWSPACLEFPVRDEEAWGVLKTTAVQQLEFQPGQNKELPTTLQPRPAAECQVGDILITRAGPTNRVGICCYVSATPPRLMISDKIVRFRPSPEMVFGPYLALALSVGSAAAQIEKAKSGMAASQVNISQAKLREVVVSFPADVSEQRLIVAKVDELLALCDALKACVCDADLTGKHLADAIVERAAA